MKSKENLVFLGMMGSGKSSIGMLVAKKLKLNFIDIDNEIENKVKESQENLKKIEVIGVSGGDVVKITLNGDGEMTKILLSDKVLKEDKEIIQDLITAAHNDAKNKLKSKTSEEISKATGGLGVPGFKWPL